MPVRSVLLVVMALVATVLLAAGTAHATFPGANGEIAYLRAGGSGFDDHSLRTRTSAGDPGPVLWPAGEPVGSGNDQAFPYQAAWSPDGMTVAMTALGGTLGNDRLLIGDPVSGDREVIFRIDELNDHLFLASIAYSPTGDRLLFCGPYIGGPTNEAHLYLIDVDGSDVTPLSERPACYGDWSVGGSIVAAAGEDMDRIVTMDADGTGRQIIVPPRPRSTEWAVGGSPSWSPDGTRFVYSLNVGSNRQFDLFSVAADGTDTERLTHTRRRDEIFPVYSPDGLEIVYTRGPEFERQQSNLFVMVVDGTDVRRLTESPRADDYAWSWRAVAP
jgi:Tol biopolymer transport system component